MKYHFFVVIEQDDCEYKIVKTILREFLGPYRVDEQEMIINKEGNREYSYLVPRIGMSEKDMDKIIDLLEPVFAHCDMAIIPYYTLESCKRFSLKTLPDKWINMKWQEGFKDVKMEEYDVIYYDYEQTPYDDFSCIYFPELVRITKDIKEIEYKKQKEIKRNEWLKNIKDMPLKQLSRRGRPRTKLCRFFIVLKFADAYLAKNNSTKVEQVLNKFFKIYYVNVISARCCKSTRVFYSSSLYIKNIIDYNKMCELIKPIFDIMDIDILPFDRAHPIAVKYISSPHKAIESSYKFEPERHCDSALLIIKDLGIKEHVNTEFYTSNDIKKVEYVKTKCKYERFYSHEWENTKFLIKYVGSLEEIILYPSKRERILSTLEKEKKKLKTTNYCYYKELEKPTEFPDLKIILPRHLRKKDKSKDESPETQEILKTLLEFGIEFVKEKRYNDCRDSNPLPFDIYFKYQGREIIIEYDDPSHFVINPTSKNSDKCGGKLKKDFINKLYGIETSDTDKYGDRRKKDFIKNLYCIKNRKYLLRIYDRSPNIRNIVINYLKNIQNVYFVTFSDIIKYNDHNYIMEYIEYLGFTY